MVKTEFPLSRDARGPAVTALHGAMHALQRQRSLKEDEAVRKEKLAGLRAEAAKNIFGEATAALVTLVQQEAFLPPDGNVDEATAKAIDARLASLDAIAGHMVFANGQAAPGLALRLYGLGFGSSETLLDEIETSADGSYRFYYDPGVRGSSVLIKAVAAGMAPVPLSTAINGFHTHAPAALNFIVPDQFGQAEALAEYGRLTTDLLPHVGELGKLADAREDAERQDVSVLHWASGWDGRLIALAATTARLSKETGLAPEPLYGMLRAGLPSDKAALSSVGTDMVKRALSSSRKAGIIDLDEQGIASATEAYAAFAGQSGLGFAVPGLKETYQDLLTASGVSENGAAVFSQVFKQHQGPPAAIWEAAREAGVKADDVGKLRVQGKLAFLAGNNTRLAATLQEKVGSKPEGLGRALVEQGLFKEDAWIDAVLSQAGLGGANLGQLGDAQKEALAAELPAEYDRGTVEERAAAYATDMALKVRTSYPTQVLAQLLEDDEIVLSADHKKDTLELLKRAADQGFRFGETPVSGFLEKHASLTAKLKDAPAAEEQLKTLQRLYQITPDDKAIPVLVAMGIRSAEDAATFDREEFEEHFSAEYFRRYGTYPAPRYVWELYSKAQQVSSVVYSLFAAVKGAAAEGPAVLAVPASRRAIARAGLVGQFPTLESLFGSLDYGECAHCRSVLSPAAYFVDLLQFLDVEPAVWNSRTGKWAREHGGVAYSLHFWHPYETLIARRPDLPHVALSCENTHTAMPYIDIVNEILEYHVANGKLNSDAVRNTGDATSDDLLAEPHHVIDKAYTTLADARYPLTLPFDLGVETVRQFCSYFDTPLARLLEAVGPTQGAQGSDAAVRETLALGPLLPLLTAADPLANWEALYGCRDFDAKAGSATDLAGDKAAVMLRSAQVLARRLSLSYRELTDIVQCVFVSPALARAHALSRFGIGIAELRSYRMDRPLLKEPAASLNKEQAARVAQVHQFERVLAERAAEHGMSVAALENALSNVPLDKLLVLSAPDAGGSFELANLRYGEGAPVDAIALLRINLFVRLWRKLGWSIEETDRVLQAFMPGGAPFDTPHLPQRPLRTALLRIAQLTDLRAALAVGQGWTRLLALWSDIGTTGKASLYEQLFLSSPGQAAKAFDEPSGNFLSDPKVKLTDQLPQLQGALGLSAGDIAEVCAGEGIDLANALLTLGNVSLLYRHAVLARLLSLTVPDLMLLKQLSGIDPFKPLADGALQDTDAADGPMAATAAFVAIARELADSNLSIADLDYLLLHGASRSDKAARLASVTAALLKSLAGGIQAILAQNTAPEAVTETALRQLLGKALAPDVVDSLLLYMSGAGNLGASAAATLKQQLGKGPGAAAQDPGFLDESDFAFLFAAVTPDEPMLAGDTVEEISRKMARNERIQEENKVKLQHKYARLLAAFLPFVDQRMVNRFLVQSLAAHAGAEAELIDSLIDDKRWLRTPAALAATLGALGQRGLDADFYDTDGAAGKRQDGTRLIADADLSLQPRTTAGGDALAAASSAGLQAFVEVPATGSYRFSVMLGKKGARARLQFDHLPNSAVLDGSASQDGDELGGDASAVQLQAGVFYRFSLALDGLDGQGARLLVQGPSMPKGSLGRLALYPSSGVDSARDALVLLAKVLEIGTTLGLGTGDLRYLLNRAGAAPLGGLPTVAQANPAGAKALFQACLGMASYARLKRDMGGADNALAAVFDANGSAQPAPRDARVYSLIAALARCDIAAVQDGAQVLGMEKGTGVSDEQALRRLWKLLQLSGRFGVAPADLKAWAGIAAPAASPAQRLAIARSMRQSLKVQFEEPAWQKLARAVSDPLRQRQRDALAAYAMHGLGLERMEQLYEYFLIDPGMEPVVHTSRIRIAIASVQLFVQRCLLNMEKKVPPAVIDGKQWQWMKRYRVWEANRKIFLYPENWLEPEFRDDKTEVFEDLEAALMEGDVSSDLVDNAFLAYLKKLDVLARLEIMAMHLEDGGEPSLRRVHVFGRTYGMPHQYFYRRYAHGEWSAWEAVGAEIEGDHLAPVFWRNRLYLFWVTFSEKLMPVSTTEDNVLLSSLTMARLTGSLAKAAGRQVTEACLHWSEYLQGEWSPRVSGALDAPGAILSTDVPYVKENLALHVHKEAYEKGSERGVFISVSGFDKSFYLAGRNSKLQVAEYRPRPLHPFLDLAAAPASRFAGQQGLRSGVRPPVAVPGGNADAPAAPAKEAEKAVAEVAWTNALIVGPAGPFTILPCNNNLEANFDDSPFPTTDSLTGAAGDAVPADQLAILLKPVFYQDVAHTMFVTAEIRQETVESWEEWLPPILPPDLVVREPVPFPRPGPRPLPFPIPRPDDPFGPFDPRPELDIDPRSVLDLRPKRDWLVNDRTGLDFGGVVIGPRGTPGSAGDFAAGTGAGLIFDRQFAGAPAIADRLGLVDIVAPSGLTRPGAIFQRLKDGLAGNVKLKR